MMINNSKISLGFFIFSALIAQAQAETVQNTQVSYPTHSGISRARDITNVSRFVSTVVDDEIAQSVTTDHFQMPAYILGNQNDPALQTLANPRQINTNAPISSHFAGLGLDFPGFSLIANVPDSEGSVGKTQYVQWVNISYVVFDKVTHVVLAGPNPGNALFVGLPETSLCRTENNGDPMVKYDQFANRWVMSQFAKKIDGNPTKSQFAQCIAVSATDDATGDWYVWQYDYLSFNDYPKLGLWSDAYFITYDMYDKTTTSSTYTGVKSCAFERNVMLFGNPSPKTICHDITKTDLNENLILLPADLDGKRPPPVGAPNPQFIAVIDENSKAWLWRYQFKVDFEHDTSEFTGPTKIEVAQYIPCYYPESYPSFCVTQPDTDQKLDTIMFALMNRVAYRNFGTYESVVLTHSVKAQDLAGERTGVRWYEIRRPNAATPLVYQQSTFSPDTDHRWMSSAAMDKLGNILIGYSRSSSVTYPSIYYTGRLRSEPLNYLQTEAPIMIGSGSQTNNGRWGDYSAMSIDPVDDCTFWYTQEYLESPNSESKSWKTRIASMKFKNCK